MKLNRVVLAALVAGGVVVAARAGRSSQDPDEKLGAHVEELCDIARQGTQEPVAGVKRLGTFLSAHSGDMLGELADTIALIERISDDDAHDARARLARERFVLPMQACERDWDRFAQAIEADEEAAMLVTHALERLDGTLGIIFEGKQRRALDLRTLPRRLLGY